MSAKNLFHVYPPGLRIYREFNIVHTAIGEALFGVLRDPRSSRRYLAGGQFCGNLLQRIRLRGIVLEDHASALHGEVVSGRPETRGNRGEELPLRLVGCIAHSGRDGAGGHTAAGVGAYGEACIADANDDAGWRHAELLGYHDRQHRFCARSQVLHCGHQFHRAIARNAHFAGGIHIDEAIPNRLSDSHAPLDWPRIRTCGPAVSPIGAFEDDLALDFARRVLINLVAQGKRIHVQLHGDLIDGLFEGEAALRMAGRAECRPRAGIDENIVSLRSTGWGICTSWSQGQPFRLLFPPQRIHS